MLALSTGLIGLGCVEMRGCSVRAKRDTRTEQNVDFQVFMPHVPFSVLGASTGFKNRLHNPDIFTTPP